MSRVALMRAAGLRPVWRFLHRAGAPVGRVLARVHLPPCVFDDRETLVPVHLAGRFLAEAARAVELPHLGALVGQTVSLPSLGVFGNLIARASTLHDAITRVERYGAYYSSGEAYWLARSRGDEVMLCHRFMTKLDEGWDQAEQYSLTIALRALRTIAGPGWTPAIHLKTGVPRAIGEIELLAGAQILFDRPICAIVFPSALLSARLHRPQTTGDDHAHGLDEWIAGGPPGDLAGGVRHVVAMHLPMGAPAIDVVADAVGASARTLQRRLAGAGTTFRRLLGETRFEATVRLLDTDGIGLGELARRVGYANLAQLDHAFRRWTGTTPREFRRRRRQSGLVAAAGAA